MELGFKSIKQKLRISFLTLIFLSASGGLLSYLLLSRVTDYQETRSQTYSLLVGLSNARKAEKDFILYDRKNVGFLETGNSQNISTFHDNLATINSILGEIRNDAIIKELNLEYEVKSIGKSIKSYQDNFAELVRAYHKRGFKDHGLEGSMREYVHNLQQCYSAEEKVYAFSLRRHEKDFIVRKDEKYVDRLFATAEEFKGFVLAKSLPHMTDDYVYQTVNAIDAYKNQFHKIIKLEREIGVDGDSGIRGRLKAKAGEVEPKIDFVFNTITAKSEQLKYNATLVLIGSFILIFIFGLVFSLILSSAISKPIILLDRVTQKVMEGDEDTQIEKQLDNIRLKDEIGSLASNFRKMIYNMKQNLALITEKNDKLELAAEEDEKRSWSIEGLAKFADIMKNHTDNLEKLSFEIISNLVKYTNSNQGGIFVVQHDDEGEEDDYLELKGCYAYNREKRRKIKLEYGEGLVGTAWRESDTIYLTDVPEDYIDITSGLGSANPNCILIVPIKSEFTVEGVLELAAFEPYQEHQIEFIQKLADRLAITITSVKMQERTTALLEDAKQMTEELRANEEEMRQNMEELQATQEEMNRGGVELNEKLDKFETRSHLLSKVVTHLFDGILLTNTDFEILHIDDYTAKKLGYLSEDLVKDSINYILKEGAGALEAIISEDPNYVINNRTAEFDSIFIDRYGEEISTRISIVNVGRKQDKHYAILIHKSQNTMQYETNSKLSKFTFVH